MPQCAICLVTDGPNLPHDRYVELPCTHYSPNDAEDCFHLSCLAQAFETQGHEGGQPSCPICRAEVGPVPFQALATQFTEDREEELPCSLDPQTDIQELTAWLDAEAQSLADRANAGGDGAPGAGGGNGGDGGDGQNDNDNDDDGGGEGQNDNDGGDAPSGGYEPPGDQEQGDNGNWGGDGGGGEGYR